MTRHVVLDRRSDRIEREDRREALRRAHHLAGRPDEPVFDTGDAEVLGVARRRTRVTVNVPSSMIRPCACAGMAPATVSAMSELEQAEGAS